MYANKRTVLYSGVHPSYFHCGARGALKCPFFYLPKYYGDSNWCLKFSSVLGFFWLLVFVVVVFTLQK